MPLAKKIKTRFTYKDYLSWPEEERYEIIEGEAYSMTPAPGREHQKICMELILQFGNFLRDKPCELYTAPFDVRLKSGKEKEDNISTVVQPDISVICDKKKLDDKGCLGAPDLIIEIISPSTASRDFKEKLDLYDKHGVKEYWIVDPATKIVMVFKQDSKKNMENPMFIQMMIKLRLEFLRA